MSLDQSNAEEIAAQTIRKHHLFRDAKFLILMVSGGCDSVALCYIMKKLFNGNLAIVHLNHNIRQDSEKDAEFVKQLGEFLNIETFMYSKNILDIANNNKQNIEECGREERLKIANQTKNLIFEKYNIAINKIKICTAHTADDRIENFYMRSIVGTGPGGFVGIHYTNEDIIHPLLDISKKEIIYYVNNIENAYSDINGDKWHEDLTNQDTNKFRSYVRNKIIPLAKNKNPQLINNLCNSMNLISDENDFIEDKTNEVTKQYFIFNDLSFQIKPDFKNENIALRRRAIYNALCKIFPNNTRIETTSIKSILDACDIHNYTNNIQQNYAVHSNKNGVVVEPMKEYRNKRNRL